MKLYYGLECEKCGKAVFFLNYKPQNDKRFRSEDIIVLPDAARPRSCDIIKCQFCEWILTDDRLNQKNIGLFYYPIGEKNNMNLDTKSIQ